MAGPPFSLPLFLTVSLSLTLPFTSSVAKNREDRRWTMAATSGGGGGGDGNPSLPSLPPAITTARRTVSMENRTNGGWHSLFFFFFFRRWRDTRRHWNGGSSGRWSGDDGARLPSSSSSPPTGDGSKGKGDCATSGRLARASMSRRWLSDSRSVDGDRLLLSLLSSLSSLPFSSSLGPAVVAEWPDSDKGVMAGDGDVDRRRSTVGAWMRGIGRRVWHLGR